MKPMDVAQHLIPHLAERQSDLLAAVSKSKLSQGKVVSAQPITKSGFVLLRYRNGELVGAFGLGQKAVTEYSKTAAHNLTKLDGPAPMELSEDHLLHLTKYLGIKADNVYVLGQIDCRRDAWPKITSGLKKITTPRKLARYVLENDGFNQRLADLLQFHALDIFGVSNQRVTRINVPANALWNHLNAAGFKCLSWNGHTSGIGRSDIAKKVMTGKWLQPTVDHYARINEKYALKGLRLLAMKRDNLDAVYPVLTVDIEVSPDVFAVAAAATTAREEGGAKAQLVAPGSIAAAEAAAIEAAKLPEGEKVYRDKEGRRYWKRTHRTIKVKLKGGKTKDKQVELETPERVYLVDANAKPAEPAVEKVVATKVKKKVKVKAKGKKIKVKGKKSKLKASPAPTLLQPKPKKVKGKKKKSK